MADAALPHGRTWPAPVSRWVAGRWPAVAASVLTAASGMAFTFWWFPLTRSDRWRSYWLVPGDIWGIFRAAQYVVWGGYGGIYTAGGGVDTLPGIVLAYAPVAAVTNAYQGGVDLPYVIPHPTAWLVLGPIELLLGCLPLFAADALARRLGLGRGLRLGLAVAQGAVVWDLLVRWGHAEDAVAVGFLLYAVLAVADDRHARAGWLLGAGLCFQPLVVLAVPFLLAEAGGRAWTSMLPRLLAPPAAVLAVPLASRWQATTTAVVQQPFQVAFARITPWTSLAPRLLHGTAVSGGPGRMVALVLAAAAGWWLGRRRPALASALWLVGILLALREPTDAIMEPYYLWPPLALWLVAAASQGRRRLLAVSAASLALVVATGFDFRPWWAWWALAMAGTGVVGLLAWPVGRGSDPGEPGARGRRARPLAVPSRPARRVLARTEAE